MFNVTCRCSNFDKPSLPPLVATITTSLILSCEQVVSVVRWRFGSTKLKSNSHFHFLEFSFYCNKYAIRTFCFICRRIIEHCQGKEKAGIIQTASLTAYRLFDFKCFISIAVVPWLWLFFVHVFAWNFAPSFYQTHYGFRFSWTQVELKNSGSSSWTTKG